MFIVHYNKDTGVITSVRKKPVTDLIKFVTDDPFILVDEKPDNSNMVDLSNCTITQRDYSELNREHEEIVHIKKRNQEENRVRLQELHDKVVKPTPVEFRLPIEDDLDMLFDDIKSGLFGEQAKQGKWFKHKSKKNK